MALLAASHQRRSPEWSWRGEPPPEALRFQGWNPPPQPPHASAGQPLSTHAEPRSFSAQLAALHQTFQRTRWCRRGHRRPLLLVQLLETGEGRPSVAFCMAAGGRLARGLKNPTTTSMVLEYQVL